MKIVSRVLQTNQAQVFMGVKILFCSHLPLLRELGATKVLVELAQALSCLGWECDLIGPAELRVWQGGPSRELSGAEFKHVLRDYIVERGGQYDVVDYFHDVLPFDRITFSDRPLMVARSVLLVHYLKSIKLPQPAGLFVTAKRLLGAARHKGRVAGHIRDANLTIRNADLINVSNDRDKLELMRYGLQASKIEVQPFGLSSDLRARFDAVSDAVPERPVVAFVGTFDFRKGAAEFPKIIGGISSAVPACRFRLLGTRGLFRTAEEVLRHFPGKEDRLEVYPTFAPEELPSLLSDCSVGIFPSHMEGFGFGVLEMLAAAIPVVAYDVPGPPMMLTENYLVRRGDAAGMAARVTALLADRASLKSARTWARARSRDFCWDRIARATADCYLSRISARGVAHTRTGTTAVLK